MDTERFQQHQVTPGASVRLSEIATSGKKWGIDKDDAKAEFKTLRDELIEWQTRWYADGRRKLLVIFQAMDAGGKDGTIGQVFKGINPQGVQVTAFKAPTREELAHDFLWRVHRAVPASGQIGIFNRSHYEDVLVVRVDNLAPEAVWRARYEQINHFEALLSQTGTTILKFYLHISPEEQRQRFQERVDDPAKHWKFSLDDLAKRRQWEDYMAAYEEMLGRCSTPAAPWHIIPADHNWYRNLAVTRVLVGAFRQLNPQYPAAKGDFAGLIVE